MKSQKLKRNATSGRVVKKHAKKTPKRHDISLTLVGMKYRMSKQEITQLVDYVDENDGLTCRLEVEPSNDVDPKAVKVIALDNEKRVFSGRHLGYVRRPANESVFDLLRGGAKISVCVLEYVDGELGEGDLQVLLEKPSSEKSPGKRHV